MSRFIEPVSSAKRRDDSRGIRVFLASTFKDMDAWRDYLHRSVFWKIRKTCLNHHVSFSEIDLRRGTIKEDAKNGRAVEICLEEIDRRRNIGTSSFFIGLLGER